MSRDKLAVRAFGASIANRLRRGSLKCWSCCRSFRRCRQTTLQQYTPVYSRL
ncbi:hypothetical protein BU25DRAFT_410729 [Macroventuria anomochaeta]|uniref:Uncharacterized protein n=1 Tax=Macroventuria anomochaeta TaxID=301207 RepID=A0ACB6RZW3_9PLEO|nr:uncharacterized protein BU25DRAFT_410729 [Macroventuria anomochaeta]KAF2627575.1 hypothetical protein BU25DRAFT_410729 [Macroventuria anomochaeta]